MLSRLAKPLAIQTITWKSVHTLTKYLGEQISSFWHKPRVDVPRIAAAKPRIKCNTIANGTSSHCKPDCKRECAFQKPITIDGLLCLTLIGGGVLLVVDTCGRKYRLLRQAKQEWDAKSEHEESIPTTEMKRGRLYPSRAQDYKKVDKDDSKNLSIGKWAWVLQRANEIEQEKRRRVERK